jgi:hypothetical protein
MVSSNKVSDTIREDITIVAGFDRQQKVKNSVERFSWKNNVWVKIASLNIARMYVTSFLFGDELYVVGGVASGAMEALNLNEAPGKWTLLAAELSACYEGHRTLVYQNRLILIGGSEIPSIIPVDLISEILLTPPYTSKVLCRMHQPRKYFGAELFEDRILIFGGRTDDGDYKSSLNSVLEFDLNTNECRNLSQLPCAQRRSEDYTGMQRGQARFFTYYRFLALRRHCSVGFRCVYTQRFHFEGNFLLKGIFCKMKEI